VWPLHKYNWHIYDKVMLAVVLHHASAPDESSPNDTMIDELLKLIHNFPGASNCAWCFNHVVALITIRVVCQFDISKGGDNWDSESEQELQELAEGLDIEDAMTQREWKTGKDKDNDNGIEGWANERSELSAADHDESVRPV